MVPNFVALAGLAALLAALELQVRVIGSRATLEGARRQSQLFAGISSTSSPNPSSGVAAAQRRPVLGREGVECQQVSLGVLYQPGDVGPMWAQLVDDLAQPLCGFGGRERTVTSAGAAVSVRSAGTIAVADRRTPCGTDALTPLVRGVGLPGVRVVLLRRGSPPSHQ
jgi:hypothetical protein